MKYAKAIVDRNYINQGEYYQVLSDGPGSNDIVVRDNCGDRNSSYTKNDFGVIMSYPDKMVGMNVQPTGCFGEFFETRIYSITDVRFCNEEGPMVRLKGMNSTWYRFDLFKLISGTEFKTDDILICCHNNSLTYPSRTTQLTNGNLYRCLGSRTNSLGNCEVKVMNDRGETSYLIADRFKDFLEVTSACEDVDAVVENIDRLEDLLKREGIPMVEKLKSQIDKIKLDKCIGKFTVDSSIHGKLVITNTNTNNGGMTMTNTNKAVVVAGTTGNRFMDKMGFFGEVTGVAMTMTGKLCFMGEDNNYYSYEDGALVNNEDMVLDMFPGFAFPVPKNSVKEGDLLIQKDGTYVFVNKGGNYVNSKGEVAPIAKTKHAMFGESMEFVSKIMDMGGMFGNGNNAFDMSNPMANPMMILAMTRGSNSGEGMNDMFKMMMISQMMNQNGQQPANPMANMMPLMLIGNKDGASSDINNMMRNMFMMQMFQNQQVIK